MQRPVYEVIVGESLPNLNLWLVDGDTLIQGLDAPTAFELDVWDPSLNLLFTKTSGFVGAAGSGTEGNGSPNLVIQWAVTGELDQLVSGRSHPALLKITRSSDLRVWLREFVIKATGQPVTQS